MVYHLWIVLKENMVLSKAALKNISMQLEGNPQMQSRLLLASLLTVSVLMVGCTQQEKEPEQNVEGIEGSNQEEGNEEVSSEETAEDIAQMRLVEQGFQVEYLTTFQEEEVILLELARDGEKYYAMMNGEFEWVLPPTNTIKDIEHNPYSAVQYDLVIYEGYSTPAIKEGLIGFAVEDPRPRKDDGLLWGFMNTKGEWVIEPKYRAIDQFSDGVAIVETVEEDRDDLANSRQIAIDSKGNELFEMAKYDVNKEDEDEFTNNSFYNGYIKVKNGVYNKKGEFFSMEFLPLMDEDEDDEEGLINFEIIQDQVVTIIDNAIKVYSLQGNLIKEMKNPESDEIDSSDLKYPVKALADSKKFIVGNTIMNLDGNIIFQSESFAIENSVIVTFGGEDGVWNFYDFNGKQINDANKVGVQLDETVYNSEPHWVKGNEYYKLLSANGEVLLDEDRKISGVSNPGNKIIEAEVTDPATLDEIDVLINVETLEFIKQVDL